MYQYFDQEFSTHLQTETARVNFTHENFQYIFFGVSYHFSALRSVYPAQYISNH